MLGRRVALTAMSVASSLFSFASYTLLLKYSADTHQVDQVFQAGSLPLSVAGTLSGILLYLVPARLNQIDAGNQQMTSSALGLVFFMGTALLSASSLVYTILWGQTIFHWMVTVFVLASGVSVLSTIGLCFGQTRASYMASGTAPLVASIGLFIGSLFAISAQRPWMIVLGQVCGSLLALWFSTTAWRQRSPVVSAKFSLPAVLHSISALRHNVIPITLATLAFTVFQPIDAFVCARMHTGCMSVISYAERIAIALGTVISLGAFIVGAKTASDAFRTGGLPAAKALANRETVRILLFGVAIWPLFMIIGAPILSGLFKNSGIGVLQLQTLIDCTSTMIIGVGPMTTVPYLFRVLYSVEVYKIPAYIGLAVPITYASIAIILVPKFGATALAVAFATVWWLAFAASWLALNLQRPNR